MNTEHNEFERSRRYEQHYDDDYSYLDVEPIEDLLTPTLDRSYLPPLPTPPPIPSESHSWNDNIGSIAKFISLTGLAFLLMKVGTPEQKIGNLEPELGQPTQLDKRAHETKPPAPSRPKPLRDVLSAYSNYVQSQGGFISYDEMDCVTFLKNLVMSQQGLGLPLKASDAQRLLIDFSELNNEKGYREALARKDPRMKGIVNAFVQMGIGEEVRLGDLKGENGRGLFVQYHYGAKGHAAIVESIKYDRDRKPVSMTILGSHGMTNGTGKITVRFSKIDQVFFVKLKS